MLRLMAIRRFLVRCCRLQVIRDAISRAETHDPSLNGPGLEGRDRHRELLRGGGPRLLSTDQWTKRSVPRAGRAAHPAPTIMPYKGPTERFTSRDHSIVSPLKRLHGVEAPESGSIFPNHRCCKLRSSSGKGGCCTRNDMGQGQQHRTAAIEKRAFCSED